MHGSEKQEQRTSGGSGSSPPKSRSCSRRGRESGTRGILDTMLVKPLVFGGKSGTSTFARTSCAWAAATLDLVAAVEDPAQGPLELSNGALEQRQVSKQPWLILLTKDASLRLQRGRGPTARDPKVQFPYAGESLARLNEVLQVDCSTDERTHMYLRHSTSVIMQATDILA